MFPHHRRAIDSLTETFSGDPEPTAVYLAGSIAHGFASEESDINLVIVVPDDVHARREREGQLQFFDVDHCDWPGGYAEGKYVSESFLEQVAERGSEPARFALHDAQPLVARSDYSDVFSRIARYPVEGKTERLRSFFAQVEAWHWYVGEALRRDDRYLLATAVSKLVLFGGRMVLAHNEVLYPYHKWFMRVLASVADAPDGLMSAMHALLDDPQQGHADGVRELCIMHGEWQPPPEGWPTRFLHDSELNWIDHTPPVDDL